MPTTVYKRWRGKPPTSDAVVRTAIAQEIQAGPDGIATVIDAEGRPVRVYVTNILRHVRSYPERWRIVPLIRPALTDAHQITGQSEGEGKKLYSTGLLVGKGITRHYFATYVKEDRWRIRHHETTFRVYADNLEEKQKKAGHPLWISRLGVGHRNPAPAQQGPDVVRPGRPSRAPRLNHTTDSASPSIVALALGLVLLVVARIHPYREEAPRWYFAA